MPGASLVVRWLVLSLIAGVERLALRWPRSASFLESFSRPRQQVVRGGYASLLRDVRFAKTFSAVQLILGRFIIGFATLINGSVAPMWVMELASPKYRSILSSSTVVSVPFASFLVACIILGIFDKNSNWVWRGVMLVSIFPIQNPPTTDTIHKREKLFLLSCHCAFFLLSTKVPDGSSPRGAEKR